MEGRLDTTINSNLNQALGYQQGGLTGGLGRLDAGTGAAAGAVGAGTSGALGRIDSGFGAGAGALTAGTDAARTAAGAGVGAYDPLSALGDKYGAGSSLYSDALGLGGPGGTQRAQGAFQAGPGYQFQLDQGLDAINRSRNARGMLNSGNTDVDAMKYGQGLANQEYSKYLDRLQGFQPLELSATGGAAAGRSGAYGRLSDLEATGGARMADLASRGAIAGAGIEQGGGQSLADIARTTGMYGAGLETGGGTGAAGLISGATGAQVGLGTALAKPSSDTYGQAAAAQQQGSGNLWNFGLQAAKAAAGFPGFAEGGRPPMNMPSVVGEQGPELFVPDSPGTVIPNQATNMQQPQMGGPMTQPPRSPMMQPGMGLTQPPRPFGGQMRPPGMGGGQMPGMGGGFGGQMRPSGMGGGFPMPAQFGGGQPPGMGRGLAGLAGFGRPSMSPWG